MADAEKALAKAKKAQDRAEFEYFELLKDALPAHVQRVTMLAREVADQTPA